MNDDEQTPLLCEVCWQEVEEPYEADGTVMCRSCFERNEMEEEVSFGYRDKDWIDPPESEHECGSCSRFNICPSSGCSWGWCTEQDSWVECDDDSCDRWDPDELDGWERDYDD